MPKISDLPADTAPDPADLVPFVDVTASRTESVTVANLAASTAFSGQYATVVEHGATASTARPSTAGVVLWIGSVTPTNAEATDVVVGVPGVSFVTTRRASADIALTTTWGIVHSNLVVELAVGIGDVVQFTVSGRWGGGEATNGFLDVYSANRLTRIGYIDDSANGVPGWAGAPSQVQSIGGSWHYTVQSGDIVDGLASFRLWGKAGSGTKTLQATVGTPIIFTGLVVARA